MVLERKGSSGSNAGSMVVTVWTMVSTSFRVLDSAEDEEWR